MKIKYYRWLMAITLKDLLRGAKLAVGIALGLGMSTYSAYSASTQRPINHATLEAIAADNAEAERTLLIWTIGDPGKDSLPDTDIPNELRQRAKKFNYKLEAEAVSARSATAKLREAIKQNRQPDIITYGDREVLEGTENDSEKLAGIYSINGVRESLVVVNKTLNSLRKETGWITLLKTSPNHDVAKQLALPELSCGNTAETKLIGEVDRNAIEEFALNYAQNLFSKSKTEFRKYLSKSAIVGLEEGDLTGMPSKDIEICSVVANDNLAAVSTAIAHDAPGAVGQVDLLMVLHSKNGSWHLLTQQLGFNENFKPYINKLANALADSSQNTSDPLPASNLSPENIRPKPAEGEKFGEFTWQPSQSNNVVAEVVEFSTGINVQLSVKFRDDSIAVEDSISAGEIHGLNDGIEGQRWHWRVWSIADDGSIAFSETKTFPDD